ncbi:PhoH family protein [Haliangium ochraceum]|uniref:PhoH-like protein n=1 Tax=Haliangium ochraceum (strain DSM 14365 / JCM 11303 / SMP-2) TaxID=502025 RepID=D0LI17_HALO1|nr:PhoH family protein [Haliangium ochraceum]ACY14846.1 PhoH family protein [Haliangium ochraceum DSM 14365]
MRDKMVFDDAEALLSLCGQSNQQLKMLASAVGAGLYLRGNEITIEGSAPELELARSVLGQIYGFALRGKPLANEDIVRAVAVLRADHSADLREIFSDTILVPRSGRPVTPKGLAQKRYVDAVRTHDVVFAVGPAGTGKTYLAMAMAVRALLDKQIKRIILTRPAVEAGERLGFLPGSLEEKVNPYLRPLYDALHDMLDAGRVERFMEQDVIEVAPLAFMRGRTLSDSFVILDEAQNTTGEQMRMFLTRLGFGSKAVVTGDITQSDLPNRVRSGLREALHVLDGVKGIHINEFTEVDVVRHPLVQKIIRAYDRFDQHREAEREERKAARLAAQQRDVDDRDGDRGERSGAAGTNSGDGSGED